jgi:hypothetical protein
MKLDNCQQMAHFYNRVRFWSEATFGSAKERGPFGPLKHAMRETEEAIAAPEDLEEYVDIMHLLFDAAWRAEVPYQQIMWNGKHQFLTDMQVVLADLLYNPDPALFSQGITTLFAAAFFAGFTLDQFMVKLWEKFEKNQKREWPKVPHDQPCEHKRD